MKHRLDSRIKDYVTIVFSLLFISIGLLAGNQIATIMLGLIALTFATWIFNRAVFLTAETIQINRWFNVGQVSLEGAVHAVRVPDNADGSSRHLGDIEFEMSGGKDSRLVKFPNSFDSFSNAGGSSILLSIGIFFLELLFSIFVEASRDRRIDRAIVLINDQLESRSPNA